MGTDNPMRILFVEDMPSDTEIAARELKKGGILFTSARVDTKEAFLKALEEFRPDIIISDYSMPQFDGMQALKLAKQYDETIPFIVLTGSLNEETAVECMKIGARDYVIKESIARLPFAVREALGWKKVQEEKEAAVKALQESEARYRLLHESMTDCFVQTTMSGEIVSVNRSYLTMLGYSDEEVRTLRYQDLTPKQWHSVEEKIVETQIIPRGFSDVYEKEYIRKDGSVFPVELRTFLLRDDQGDPSGMWAIVRDITERKKGEEERKKLQAQLLQAQKMEAVGQLAGGIAHDFNNILTAMIGYGHMLQIKLKENDTLRTYADHILSLSEKAANLTQSLLAFSRKQVINPRPVNLNEIIRTVDKLLFRIIGEDIQLETDLSEKDLIIMADHVQIEQVLMNLATNARDAMPGGGLLTIGTDTVDIDHEFIRKHGYGKEGPYAVISVTDSGEGMDRETREKIFEPFFTTKEVGKGTGLGLSMVYGIIKQNEGYITVYSEPGKGSTFRIYLPLIQASVDEIKPEAIQPLETGTEFILLAEDETEVREFTKKLLEEYGYKVIEATDGEDAIGKFRLHKNKIQLVILDVIMPNRNGREVYEAIRKLRPDIKVLFTSGYPSDHIRGMMAKGSEFISKPVSPTRLLQKIREILDA